MTKYLGLNISDELSEKIDIKLSQTGQTKTDFVTSLLNKELGMSDRKPALQVRIQQVEEKMAEFSDRLSTLEAIAESKDGDGD
jgi:hypothetical protein